MPKPIGHQSINLKASDKVGRGVQARYGPPSGPPTAGPGQPRGGPKPTPATKVKYKSRKK